MRYLIILLAFAFACNQNSNEAPKEEQSVIKPKGIARDSSYHLFLNKVYVFEETGELYTSLYFNKEYGYDSIESIMEHFDSLVFQDDENRRQRIPIEKAKKYFNMSLLDSLYIFNLSPKLLTTAPLVRVEFLEGLIEDEFIAVFKPRENIEEKDLFGIGGINHFFNEIGSAPLKGERFTDIIKSNLNVKPKYEWRTTNLRIRPYNSILSTYSFSNEDEENITYIFEIKDDKAEILSHLSAEFIIWDLYPAPIQVNGKPVLLLHLVVPETDMSWHSPAVFDGLKYEIATNSRIKVRSINN